MTCTIKCILWNCHTNLVELFTYQDSAAADFVETFTKSVELHRNRLVEDVIDIFVHILRPKIEISSFKRKGGRWGELQGEGKGNSGGWVAKEGVCLNRGGGGRGRKWKVGEVLGSRCSFYLFSFVTETLAPFGIKSTWVMWPNTSSET